MSDDLIARLEELANRLGPESHDSETVREARAALVAQQASAKGCAIHRAEQAEAAIASRAATDEELARLEQEMGAYVGPITTHDTAARRLGIQLLQWADTLQALRTGERRTDG